jgi:ammonia channel protein AmtB
VHGCCGLIGILCLAFFQEDKGILYTFKSYTDDDGVKVIAGFELLLIQSIGGLVICLWSGTLSAIFFFISKKYGYLRMSIKEEILGGDLLYFGPVEFQGHLSDYDKQN